MTVPRTLRETVPAAAALPGDALVRIGAPQLSSVEEVITRTLRDAIRRGELRPGERLPQERLAEQLHVSRIPLRDALRRLEVENLVRIDPHRGAEVVSLSPADVREMYEIIMTLEEVAMRRAISGLDAESATRLIEMSDRMDAVLGDAAADAEALRAFYVELYLHAKNSRMTMMIMRLRDGVQRYHVLRRTPAALHAHAAMRRAIAARDADSAVRGHLAHLRRIRDDLASALERDVPARADSAPEERRHISSRERRKGATSAEDTVTSSLRDKILRGEIAPGERLLQHELADGFGVSRIPLRDALRRLEVEGLIRIDPRRGAYVVELTPTDVHEIYELRALLESLCMRTAVNALDEDAISETLASSRAMERTSRSVADARARRREFYEALYARAGKPHLLELILRLRDEVHRYHVMRKADVSKAHEDLRAKIARRDADGAAAVIERHLRQAGNDLTAALLKQQR